MTSFYRTSLSWRKLVVSLTGWRWWSQWKFNGCWCSVGAVGADVATEATAGTDWIKCLCEPWLLNASLLGVTARWQFNDGGKNLGPICWNRLWGLWLWGAEPRVITDLQITWPHELTVWSYYTVVQCSRLIVVQIQVEKVVLAARLVYTDVVDGSPSNSVVIVPRGCTVMLLGSRFNSIQMTSFGARVYAVLIGGGAINHEVSMPTWRKMGLCPHVGHL